MNRIITQSSDVVRFVLPSLLWTFSVFGSQKWIGSSPEPAMWCCAPAPGRPRGERPTRLSPPSWRWSVRGRSYAGSCSRGQTQDSWRFKSGGPATAVLSRLILFILFLWVKEVNQLVTCLFVFSVHLNCFELSSLFMPTEEVPGMSPSPHFWNLRAAIWFSFHIASFVLLFGPLPLTVVSFIC